MNESDQEHIEREASERAYENRQIQASLARENEFYRSYYFPSTPEEIEKARALREADWNDRYAY